MDNKKAEATQGKYGPSKLTIEPSSIKKANPDYYPGGLRQPIEDTATLPSWGVFVILIISFLLLKKLIYIKDEKRHGQ